MIYMLFFFIYFHVLYYSSCIIILDVIDSTDRWAKNILRLWHFPQHTGLPDAGLFAVRLRWRKMCKQPQPFNCQGLEVQKHDANVWFDDIKSYNFDSLTNLTLGQTAPKLVALCICLVSSSNSVASYCQISKEVRRGTPVSKMLGPKQFGFCNAGVQIFFHLWYVEKCWCIKTSKCLALHFRCCCLKYLNRTLSVVLKMQ